MKVLLGGNVVIYPRDLEKGYKIGVTATSSGLDSEIDHRRVENAKEHFKKLGYPVIETNNVRKEYKGRSSDGQTRANQIMELYKNPDLAAIIAASGGNYLFEMLEFLDMDVIKNNPKWFQGFSDNTGLTFTITTNLDIATIYANNFGSFGMKDWHSSLMDNVKILEGQDFPQSSYDKYQENYYEKITGLEGFVLEEDVSWKNIFPEDSSKGISMEGRAIGGCLDVLLNLVGTRYDKTKEFVSRYKDDGILWYLESYNLSSEALSVGLWQLKEAGWFENASGFIFGRPAMYSSYTDTNYEEALLSVLKELNLPIIMDADIGHRQPQFAMINGAIAKINSKDGRGSIIFERS